MKWTDSIPIACLVRSASTMVVALCGALSLVGPTTAKTSNDLQGSGRAAACSDLTLASTSTAAALRDLIDACKANTEIAITALSKLNSLPLPADQVVKLNAASTAAGKRVGQIQEHRSFEASVFFGSGEAYPPDAGFQALAALVARINASGGEIKSVSIIGGADAAEADTSIGRSLARARAEIVHRYLLAAGVDRQRVQAAITMSRNTIDPAQDRAARVALIVEMPE